MEKKDLVVTVVVTLLGILSAALGFAAEAKRVKTVEVKNEGGRISCNFRTSPAAGLSLGAAIVLLLAHIVIHAISGFRLCRKGPRNPGNTLVKAWILFLFSWCAFIFGLSTLFRAAGIYRNGNLQFEGSFWRCYVVTPGTTAAGAMLGLISVLLGILYYHTAARLKKIMEAERAQLGQEMPIAQPQFPPQPPIFVHEDTYNRRQIP